MKEISKFFPNLANICQENLRSFKVSSTDKQEITIDRFAFFASDFTVYNSYKTQNKQERFQICGSGNHNDEGYYLLREISSNNKYFIIDIITFETIFTKIVPPSNHSIWQTLGKKILLKAIQEPTPFICTLISGRKSSSSNHLEQDYYDKTELLGFLLEDNDMMKHFNLFQIESIELAN